MSPSVSSICRRFADESRPRPDEFSSGSLVKSQAKVLEVAGNLRINNQATAPRRQGDKPPRGPPVRPVAGELQTRCGHN